MSVSQFDVFLVPPSVRTLEWGSGKRHLPDIPKSVLDQARDFLTRAIGKPWRMVECVHVYGPEDGNRIDVAWDDTGDGEIQARIDARTESIGFCRQVCALAREMGLLLYVPESSQILDPDSTGLQFALERSAAAAHVKHS
jgi:hypothetical protein